MILSVTRRIAAAGVLAAAVGVFTTVAVAGEAGASLHNARPHSASLHNASPLSASPQQRQIGAAELSGFKVVLTATRGTGQPPTATVTAAGYQRSGTGWKLIAVKRIGAPNQWFWFAVDTCSLNITQFKGVSPVQNIDSITVSLLATPALGCTQPVSEHWMP
jgi:hypothetical protein